MKKTLLLLLLLSGKCFAQAPLDNYVPDIKLGYKPDASSDEGGFWYKVDKLEEEIKISPYVIRDTELNDYVNNMVCLLAGDYCDQVRVYILKNPHFNASMAPNGMMLVHTGLLLRAANESQLAAVIGHEIAHYLRAHQIKQWRSAKSSLLIAQILDMTLTGGLATMMTLSGIMSYSREHESEADMYGLQLLAKSGYDPKGAADLWAYVDEEREADKSKKKRNSFFSTHPKNETRMKDLELATESYLAPSAEVRDDFGQFKMVMTVHYEQLMDEQMSLQEYEQTELLLIRHETMGYPMSLINFYKGELYRQRNQEADREKAIESYQASINTEGTPVSTYRELGYLFMKEKRHQEALNSFSQYLEESPNADDFQMINFYVDSIEKKIQ